MIPIGRTMSALAAGLLLAGCSSTLSPEDPTDIAAWMDLYDVPGVSVAVFSDFALDYVEVHGVTSESTMEPVTEYTLFEAASHQGGVFRGHSEPGAGRRRVAGCRDR